MHALNLLFTDSLDHTLSWKNIRSEIYEDGFTWDILARHLGMTQKKIDIIWSSSLETEVNLKQTIKWWLHQRDASWSGLAEALQEMDHKKLADQIRRNHPQVSVAIYSWKIITVL